MIELVEMWYNKRFNTKADVVRQKCDFAILAQDLIWESEIELVKRKIVFCKNKKYN